MRTTSPIDTVPNEVRKPKKARPAEGKAYIEALLQKISQDHSGEFEIMKAELIADDPGASSEERVQFDIIAHSTWQFNCLARCEDRIWKETLFKAYAEKSPLGAAFVKRSADFARIRRLMDASDRTFYLALDELRRLRAQRLQNAKKASSSTDPDGTAGPKGFPGTGWIM